MTDFQSQPELDDEQLSAYLDGELSPEERARVDARLASDPAARQLLDQLRAASQAMQSLPQETVGQDLRESILRRAEAAMLASNGGRSAIATTKPALADDAVSLRDSLPQLTIGQTRRGWVWAALAMAAGLLIMVFQPGDQEGNSNLGRVAVSSRDELGDREGLDRVAARDRADVPELRNLQVAEPATVAPAPAEQGLFANAPTATGSGASGTAAPTPSDMAFEALPSSSARPATADAPAALNDDLGLMANDGVTAGRTPALRGAMSGGAQQPSRAGGAPARVPLTGQFGDEAKEASIANGSVPSVAMSGPASTSAPESQSRYAVPTQRPVGGESQLELAVTRPMAEVDALAKAQAQPKAEDFLLVHVVVTPEAQRNKAFDQLLKKNGIQLEEPAKEKQATASSSEKRADANEALREAEKSGSEFRDKGGQPQTPDAVLVAAPIETIELCLADLKQDRANYLGVNVEDANSRIAKKDDADKSLKEAEAVPTRKLTTDLGTRFNRGEVSSQDFDQYYHRYFYDYSDSNSLEGESGGRSFGGFAGGGSGGAAKPTEEQLRERAKALVIDAKDQVTEGRARRIESWGFDDARRRELLKSRETTADAWSKTELQFGTKSEGQDPADAAGNNVYVLFVLSPDTKPGAAAATTTPSLPAEDPPK